MSVHVDTVDRQTDSQSVNTEPAEIQVVTQTHRQRHRPESMDTVNGSGHVLFVIDVSGFWVEDLKE